MNDDNKKQWHEINALGHLVEEKLQSLGVGLTMGGEPTFICLDDFESAQWRTDALGGEKREIAVQLLSRLARRFAQGGGLLHYGLGKLYPGERFPRWSLGYFWREDGIAIWHHPELMAEYGKNYGHTLDDGKNFLETLVKHLGVRRDCILEAYEKDSDKLVGYTLPLLSVIRNQELRFCSCHWNLPGEKLYLLKGTSSLGLRIPLNSIDWGELELEATAPINASPTILYVEPLQSADNSICVALSVEILQEIVHVFLPPMASARSFLDLIGAIEDTAKELGLPVIIDGYSPPQRSGIQGLQITPDPGVIEVNIQPANNWDELVRINTGLYLDARHCRLGTEKYLIDGRRISTGGGAHITLGGKTPEQSPILRRPDLLQSLISYWNNHPSLSYLFSGLFVGHTCQSPRVDEVYPDNLYELELAFKKLQNCQTPELIDILLGKLLVDVTGNTHRTSFCIDKLFPVNNISNQLGLLELRFFAMPPTVTMRLIQMLLVRALVAWFWQFPYKESLIRWGTTLHDRFMLPYYIRDDLLTVIAELKEAGYLFKLEWFEPFFEFRFPLYGEVNLGDLQLELRGAIEIWPVLPDGIMNGGTSRPVDDSLERIQVTLKGVKENIYFVTCNGYVIPMQPSVVPGEYVGAVRFRARQYGGLPHPDLTPHTPLVFEVIEQSERRSLGGCTYYVASPSGKSYQKFPTNHQEADLRMKERFIPFEGKPGVAEVLSSQMSLEYPLTLDLRATGVSEC